uniref:Uncharacterized protein n=1 Tax=Panagrolaimus sp. JU765 TaxID=591449 RepID=A0AC34R987_9BILA
MLLPPNETTAYVIDMLGKHFVGLRSIDDVYYLFDSEADGIFYIHGFDNINLFYKKIERLIVQVWKCDTLVPIQRNINRHDYTRMSEEETVKYVKKYEDEIDPSKKGTISKTKFTLKSCLDKFILIK